MIGILSNKSKIKTYSNNLLSLFHSSLDYKFHSIIVFTIFDIDFSNKTVSGNLITKDSIEICKIPIPSIIYNFSYQQKNSDKKKIRVLAEQDDVILVNETNRFSQDMIMEMLSSCPQFNPMLLEQLDLLRKERKKDIFSPDKDKFFNTSQATLCNNLVIPDASMTQYDGNLAPELPSLISQVNLNYNMHNTENVTDEFNKDGILILPKKRFYSSKAIWLKKDFEHDCYINQNQKNDMSDLLVFDSKLTKKKWIIFEAPDLLLYKNHPVIITLYIQRGIYGKWISLPRIKLPKELDENDTLIEKLNSVAIEISGYIGHFIPNLAFCRVTFVLDKNINPFFINLGGWTPILLLAKNNHDLHSSFINNLFDYYDFLKMK